MPTTAKYDPKLSSVGFNTTKRKTSGSIAKNSCSYELMCNDSYKPSNVGKIAGGLAGVTFSLHNLFKPNNCFAKYIAEVQKTSKVQIKTPKITTSKNSTKTINGIVGTAIMAGLGIAIGGGIDKVVSKAKSMKAEKDLADLEINRNID